jgi:hypothetical protein
MRTSNSIEPVEAITNQWPASTTWWQFVPCLFLALLLAYKQLYKKNNE